MKKVFWIIIGIVFLLTVPGCGVFNQNYIQKDTGIKSSCHSWGFGIIGFPVAIATFYECKKEHEKAGYIPVSEEEK